MPKEAHPYSGHCSISASPVCNCPCGGKFHGRYLKPRVKDSAVVKEANRLLRQLDKRR